MWARGYVVDVVVHIFGILSRKQFLNSGNMMSAQFQEEVFCLGVGIFGESVKFWFILTECTVRRWLVDKNHQPPKTHDGLKSILRKLKKIDGGQAVPLGETTVTFLLLLSLLPRQAPLPFSVFISLCVLGLTSDTDMES